MDIILREEVVAYLKQLRSQIIDAFEQLEPSKRFEQKPWEHHTGGGGEIGLIRGDIFEKAAVNWSGVSGDTFPMNDAEGPFFATGISLITHMMNPHAPTIHMNVRFIQTKKRFWFGGGYDLTPMGFPYQEDTDHFHDVAKKALLPFGQDLYALFSQNAKEYYYIPHRKKERGVGGLFFDHWNTGDVKKDLQMWQNIGNTFLDTILPIYKKRIHQHYDALQKQEQQRLRGHYAEFNLAYDRGTKFGFLSGGNPEAILCSMPPVACW